VSKNRSYYTSSLEDITRYTMNTILLTVLALTYSKQIATGLTLVIEIIEIFVNFSVNSIINSALTLLPKMATISFYGSIFSKRKNLNCRRLNKGG